MKHLNPRIPSFRSGTSSSWIFKNESSSYNTILYNCYTWFPGIMPPQNATSTKTLSEAALNFSAKFPFVVVGGIEFL
jgi:hypothetical protein